MRRLLETCGLIVLCALLGGATRAPAETPAQYKQRTARFYETEYVPKAVAQVSKRAGLTREEGTRVANAIREHIDRFLDVYGRKPCFSRSDWHQLLSRFDESVAKSLPGPKAAAVAAWRKKPWPEGNALGFLFFSPWMQFAKFDEAVTKRSSGGAIDCGFRSRSSSCVIDQCVLDAVKKKVAFRAMYEDRGIDSQVAHAIVGRADGKGIVLHWDSMGSTVTERPCRFRIGRSPDGGEYVNCE